MCNMYFANKLIYMKMNPNTNPNIKRLDKLAEENNRKMAEAERARVDMERERQQAIESGDVQRLQVRVRAKLREGE
jgi:hypothetical protein